MATPNNNNNKKRLKKKGMKTVSAAAATVPKKANTKKAVSAAKKAAAVAAALSNNKPAVNKPAAAQPVMPQNKAADYTGLANAAGAGVPMVGSSIASDFVSDMGKFSDAMLSALSEIKQPVINAGKMVVGAFVADVKIVWEKIKNNFKRDGLLKGSAAVWRLEDGEGLKWQVFGDNFLGMTVGVNAAVGTVEGGADIKAGFGGDKDFGKKEKKAGKQGDGNKGFNLYAEAGAGVAAAQGEAYATFHIFGIDVGGKAGVKALTAEAKATGGIKNNKVVAEAAVGAGLLGVNAGLEVGPGDYWTNKL